MSNAAYVKVIVTGWGVGVTLTAQPESTRRQKHNGHVHLTHAVRARERLAKPLLHFLVSRYCRFAHGRRCISQNGPVSEHESHAYARVKAVARRRAGGCLLILLDPHRAMSVEPSEQRGSAAQRAMNDAVAPSSAGQFRHHVAGSWLVPDLDGGDGQPNRIEVCPTTLTL